MNMISEVTGKEHLTIPQPEFPEIDWRQIDLSEFEDLDTATAISEAHDDPC